MIEQVEERNRLRVIDEMRALRAYESEIDARASNVIVNADVERLVSWNPLGNDRLLYSLRASRLSMLAMIMYDLDGCALDCDPASMSERFMRFHGQIAELVREAKSTLVDIVLCIPEKVMKSDGKESKELLSVGGFDETGISFYVEIPEEKYASLYVNETGNDRYLASSRWMMLNKMRRLRELEEYLGLEHRPKELRNDVFGEVDDYVPMLLDEYAAYAAGNRARGYRAPGRLGTDVISDSELAKRNMLAAAAAMAWLTDIEALGPLLSASGTGMAALCYEIAGQEPLPAWVEELAKLELSGFSL